MSQKIGHKNSILSAVYGLTKYCFRNPRHIPYSSKITMINTILFPKIFRQISKIVCQSEIYYIYIYIWSFSSEIHVFYYKKLCLTKIVITFLFMNIYHPSFEEFMPRHLDNISLDLYRWSTFLSIYMLLNFVSTFLENPV